MLDYSKYHRAIGVLYMIEIAIGRKKEEEIARDGHGAISIEIPVTDHHHTCAIIANLILDQLISTIYEDEELSEFKKVAFHRNVMRSREPVEKYLHAMKDEDAQELIDRIKVCLE